MPIVKKILVAMIQSVIVIAGRINTLQIAAIRSVIVLTEDVNEPNHFSSGRDFGDTFNNVIFPSS
jgi:hypothetical protein